MSAYHDLDALPAPFMASLDQRVLATLATVRSDGSPHLVAVGLMYDPEARRAWIVTRAASVKARNVAANGRASVCQFDGKGSWFTLEGAATVVTDPDVHAEAKQAYLARYGGPDLPTDAVIEIAVQRAMGAWW